MLAVIDTNVLVSGLMKKGTPPASVIEALNIERNGVAVVGARFEPRLPDAGDQPFADVAFTGGADLLITGNLRHFPVGDRIRVVTPRQWLDLKASLPR